MTTDQWLTISIEAIAAAGILLELWLIYIRLTGIKRLRGLEHVTDARFVTRADLIIELGTLTMFVAFAVLGVTLHLIIFANLPQAARRDPSTIPGLSGPQRWALIHVADVLRVVLLYVESLLIAKGFVRLFVWIRLIDGGQPIIQDVEPGG